MRTEKRIRRQLELLILLALFPARVFGFCHELEVVQTRVLTVAASPGAPVSIEWLGHSTFEITSSRGTRILTDPHGRFDLPQPTLPHHIVTTSHHHGPHSSVWMAVGNPVVLQGLARSGADWQRISTTIRDVSVYTVPAYHDKSQGLQRGKNALFVFRVDDICIAHLGDLGHVLTAPQLKMLGKIDILLVPIAGGMYTVTASEAWQVTKQVNPRVAIPKHYWWEGATNDYIRDYSRVRLMSERSFKISKAELPPPIEIVVLPWTQR